MRKYEEEHYNYENIRTKIYPWVKEELSDSQALNGTHFCVGDTPVIPFVGDLHIVFVIKRGEGIFEILKDNMLPPDCNIEELYHISCENLNRDVEFVIGNTMYGAFSIFADGYHEASAVCFKHIWQVCVDKLKQDLIIMIPAKDTVLFAPASETEAVRQMEIHGQRVFEEAKDSISSKRLLFSKDRKELSVYETAD